MKTVKALLAAAEKEDFATQLRIVEGPRGYSVVHESIRDFSCGPFPTDARAEEEARRLARTLKAFTVLYLTQHNN